MRRPGAEPRNPAGGLRVVFGRTLRQLRGPVRRAGLAAAATLATVLACEPSDVAEYAGSMSGVDGVETAMFISSAAFVLLRLVGHLSEDDRLLALAALDLQIRILPEINPAITTTPPVLLTQRDDLASWRNPA